MKLYVNQNYETSKNELQTSNLKPETNYQEH